ncbi:MAG: putative O-glycosylation ligase, exosortase A system-associated [Halieaceae bacterium]|nr:putative O-glycosylation ligase, exosortase A system-associated [Halieaceae bacterium]
MRDIIVTLMVFGTIPFILRNPWYGVLAWSWLSYQNPHKLAWGFANNMPFAQIVAIVLLVSLILHKDQRQLPKNGLVIVWALFFVWLVICALVGLEPEYATETIEKVVKIQLIVFVTMLLMKDFEKVNQLIWMIVFSIGFFSVKGGIFTVLTGGGYHVFGPPASEIEENNALAVAILMIVPLMVYMYRFPPQAWVKKIMPLCIFFSIASVLGSQSRGALIAIAAVGVFYWWKSRTKIVTGFLIIIMAFLGYQFMPQSWHERMATISEYEEDSSAMERITAWKFTIAVANDRFTGGGFNSSTLKQYIKYGIETVKEKAFVAHSIYFGVLGDGGWPGLLLYLLVILGMWRQLTTIIRLTKDDPDREDYNVLARMLQVSIVAFLAGGAFLSLQYFDLAWGIMAITIGLTQLVKGIYPRKTKGKAAASSRPGVKVPTKA